MNEGRNTHRFEENPLEEKFAKVWKEHNSMGTPLYYILGGDRCSEYYPTGRDAVVAATVIQWLGSLVGQSFLSEALGLNIQKLLHEQEKK